MGWRCLGEALLWCLSDAVTNFDSEVLVSHSSWSEFGFVREGNEKAVAFLIMAQNFLYLWKRSEVAPSTPYTPLKISLTGSRLNRPASLEATRANQYWWV